MALLVIVVSVAVSAPATALNFVSSINSHRVQDSLPYGPLPRHRLDVYAPSAAASPSGHPVVVFLYGGAWNRGERADYRFVGEALAAALRSAGVPVQVVLYARVDHMSLIGAMAWPLHGLAPVLDDVVAFINNLNY